MTPETIAVCAADEDLPSEEKLNREGLRVLRRMCESGAVLALASDMDKGVVVRAGPNGSSTRSAVVERGVARAMALKDWIACQSEGRVTRYAITQAGRSALSRLMAEEESRRVKASQGFAEAQENYGAAANAPARKSRYVSAESPLIALSRRKDRDGMPFLQGDLVKAGERLREDFELAQIGTPAGQNWERLLIDGIDNKFAGVTSQQPGGTSAQDRVVAALQFLGPGLADVALRCCCFLEGLELAEKRMGWSARSGKIVLRIALQRLRLYYAGRGDADQMIG